MDQPQRLILGVLAVAWAIFRLVRYLRVAASKRPPTAVPGSAGIVAQPAEPPAAAAATASPIEPAGSGSGSLIGGLAGALIWLGGNAVLWAFLFLLPPLEQLPVMPRLVAGVLVNFYLIHLARAAAARAGRQASPSTDGNPIQ